MVLLARLQSLAPGLAVLGFVAAVAHLVGGTVPHLSPLIVAIGCGAFVANVVDIPDWIRPGLNTHKLLLETGIVLLGARLTLGELVRTGPIVLTLAAGVVFFGVLYTEAVVGRAFTVGKRTRSLLAAGASVCGVSAVLAVAGSIDVDETDITYAVATILLFDAITLVVFPIIGGLLGISGKQFGIWAGLSLFSTGPTAAVGFTVSDTAGQWATITKLVRNTFIGVLAIGYAVHYATAASDRTDVTQIWSRFPKFLFGFLAVALAANLWTLSGSSLTSIERTGDWLFLLAFAGLGFDIDVSDLRATGIQPVMLVFVHLATVSVLTLVLVLFFF